MDFNYENFTPLFFQKDFKTLKQKISNTYEPSLINKFNCHYFHTWIF